MSEYNINNIETANDDWYDFNTVEDSQTFNTVEDSQTFNNNSSVLLTDKKYANVIFDGYVFPDSNINSNLNIKLSNAMTKLYIPIINRLNIKKGLRLLMTIMAQKEGFLSPPANFGKGSRSYYTNNPGNIGNTDSGKNSNFPSLEAGIKAQIEFTENIAKGNNTKAFKFGPKNIKPFYSKEIAKSVNNYKMSPYLPGYKFNFQGELGGYVKIYSTGARAGNNYLSMIISFFKQNGLTVTQDTKMIDIINMN